MKGFTLLKIKHSVLPLLSPLSYSDQTNCHLVTPAIEGEFEPLWDLATLGSLKHMSAHSPPGVFFPPSHAEYIQKYATEEALKEQEEGTGDSSSESSMSDFSEDEAQDMEL